MFYLKNRQGNFYKITESWKTWGNKDQATGFNTLEEAQKAHQFYFNGNRKVKVVL